MYVSSYQKKPVVVKAMQLVSSSEMLVIVEWLLSNEYPWLLGNALEPSSLEPKDRGGIWVNPEDGGLMIRTLEGDMKVGIGDWVIQDVAGEFYTCKHEIFTATYDKV